MNIYKNAWAYITRKKNRTLIIFLIVMFILSSVFTCLSILNTSQQFEDNLFKISNSSLFITKKDSSPFALSDFEGLKNIEEIDGIHPQYQTLAQLPDHKAIEGEQQIFREDLPGALLNVVDIQATNDSNRDILFSSGVFTIVEGGHIQPGSHRELLVHQEFANRNKLKLNDTISIEFVDMETLNVGEPTEYKISGIFSGKKQENYSGLTSDFSENMLFIDYQASQEQLGNHNGQEITNRISLHSDSVEALDLAYDKLSTLPIDWSEYNIEKDDQAFKKTITALQSMKQIIEMITYSILIGGLIVLSLILVLWLRERIYEIGIFLSLGVHKGAMVAQFILELLMITLPAAVVSFIVGYQLNQVYLADLFNSMTNESLGNNALAAESIGNHVMLFGQAYLLLLIIVLLAVIISCSAILFRKPKDILSKIS